MARQSGAGPCWYRGCHTNTSQTSSLSSINFLLILEIGSFITTNPSRGCHFSTGGGGEVGEGQLMGGKTFSIGSSQWPLSKNGKGQ